MQRSPGWVAGTAAAPPQRGRSAPAIAPARSSEYVTGRHRKPCDERMCFQAGAAERAQLQRTCYGLPHPAITWAAQLQHTCLVIRWLRAVTMSRICMVFCTPMLSYAIMSGPDLAVGSVIMMSGEGMQRPPRG